MHNNVINHFFHSTQMSFHSMDWYIWCLFLTHTIYWSSASNENIPIPRKTRKLCISQYPLTRVWGGGDKRGAKPTYSTHTKHTHNTTIQPHQTWHIYIYLYIYMPYTQASSNSVCMRYNLWRYWDRKFMQTIKDFALTLNLAWKKNATHI